VGQHALQAITADMLHRGWGEFDYRVDVCCVTQRALQAITADMLHQGRHEFDYRVDVSCDPACTAGHYSGHTAPSLGWV
jgi:transcription initiation factor IIF auxiliary subunit